MNWQGWVTLAVVAALFVLLQRRRAVAADFLFLAALTVLTLAGVLTPQQALAGFANPVLFTIAALFVVAGGLRWTGALDMIGHWVLGRATTVRGALMRLAAPVLGLSAFTNNTPIVAMLVPIVVDWCRRRGISPSRLLLPISYLAILGGTCTLIGTSTNLVVNSMLYQAHSQRPQDRQLRPMHLFEIGLVGLPCALAGAGYLLLWGYRRLPNRTELVTQLGQQRREYLVEMLVQPECRLVGKTVEEAGLRHLPGLFLIEIDRNGEVITPVTPEDEIRAGDRLVFTGIVSTIADLEKIPGLVPAADVTYEVHPKRRHRRHLTEVVLSASSPVIGSTVREARFRQLYGAAIVAVHRNGERLPSKIGDIRLQPGDTLLLQTRSGFARAFQNSPDFYLVADVEGSESGRYDRAWVALALLGVLVAGLTASTWAGDAAWSAWAALVVAGLMIAFRCLTVPQARAAIDLQVLITIGAALGLGQALSTTGAMHAVAGGLLQLLGTTSPWLLLAVVFFLTLLFTEAVTNTAVAVLMFPLAVELAQQGHWNARPFVMAIALAASCSFLTPVGYQTNLMVMGPGGYQPRDYLRAGGPLVLIVSAVALLLIPWWWPF